MNEKWFGDSCWAQKAELGSRAQAGCSGQVDGSASREAVKARVVPERERDLGDLGAIWSIVSWRGGGQTATWKGRGVSKLGEGGRSGRGHTTWSHVQLCRGSRGRTVPTAQPSRPSEQRFDGIRAGQDYLAAC